MKTLFIITYFMFLIQLSPAIGQGNNQLKLIIQAQLHENASEIEFSPDGKLLAVAGSDNIVSIWDLQTGLQQHVLDGHKSTISSISFSADSRYFASGGDDNKIKIWDLQTDSLVNELKLHGPSFNSGTERVSQVRFHPQRPLLASSGRDGRVIVSGIGGRTYITAQIKKGDIQSLNFSPDGSKLVFAGVNMPFIYIVNLRFDKEDNITQGHLDSIEVKNNEVWSLDFYGNEKIVYGIRDSLVVFNLETKDQRVFWLGKKEIPLKIRVLAEKHILAVNVNGKSLRIIDINTGDQINKSNFQTPIRNFDKIFDTLTFTKKTDDVTELTPVDSMMMELGKRNGVDMRTLVTDIILNYSGGTQGYTFAPGKEVIVTSEHGIIKFGNIYTNKTVRRILVNDVQNIESADADELCNHLYFVDGNDYVRIIRMDSLEITKMENIKCTKGVTKVRCLNDSVLLLRDAAANLIRVNMRSHEVKNKYVVSDLFVQEGVPIIVTLNERLVVLDKEANLPELVWQLPKKTKKIAINNKQGLAILFVDSSYTGKIELWNYLTDSLITKFTCNSYNVDNVAINNSGDLIAYNEPHEPSLREGIFDFVENKTSTDALKEYWDDIKKNRIIIRNVKTGKIVDSIITESGLTNMFFSEVGNYLIASCKNRNVIVYNLRNKIVQYKLAGHFKEVADMSIKKNNILISCDGTGGTIRMWDINNKASNIETVVPYNGSNFLMVSDENYYYSTKSSIQNVGFRYNGNMYSFGQFDYKLNRPDLVISKLPKYDKSLAGPYKNTYYKRLEKLNIADTASISFENIPDIVVNYRETANDDSVILSIKMKDNRNQLSHFNVWVNDVPAFGLKGVSIASVSKTVYDTSISIKLSYGRNFIETAVTNNKGMESFKKNVTIDRIGKRKKPNLYIVSLGVSHYQNMDTLLYPEKDAEDIISCFEKLNLETLMFNEIKSRTMINQQVIKDSLNPVFNFLKQADQNDFVVLFISGHGNRENNNTVFCPYNYTSGERVTQGISYESIDTLLGDLFSRKKILLLNTCHSGEFDNNYYVFDKMQSMYTDLRKSSGTCVFTSSEKTFVDGGNGSNNGLVFSCVKTVLEKNDHLKVSEFFEQIMEIMGKNQLSRSMPSVRYQSINNDFDFF